MNLISAIIYFICCHGGPTSHFGEFAEDLALKGHSVEILATGPALEKLQVAVDFNPEALDLDDPLSQQILAINIAQTVESGSIIITDVGHILMARVQEEVSKNPTIIRFAYYDNPEPFVPGGYSETAAEVMSHANKVLFSNTKLAQGDDIGIGYYPLAQVQFFKCARDERHEVKRRDFFKKHNLVDVGQKIIVYFGGNNDVYFQDAFAAFLNILNEAQLNPSEYIVLIQQPKKIEQNLVQNVPFIFSEMSTENAIILADLALYYQTSLSPQFVLAGIPTIQIGHKTYPDILVHNQLALSVCTAEEFKQALESPVAKQPNQILEELGIAKDWIKRLEDALSL